MGRLIFLLAILLLTSCGQEDKTEKSRNTETLKDTSTQALPIKTLETNNTTTKFEKALTFINGYIDNCNKMGEAIDIVEWVHSNDLTTNDFKIELKRILDEAYEEEPEVGLDFDPILDAQDFPEEGFELESAEEKTNYLTIRGKDWNEFKLTIKLIEKNGDWLVDGCGIVNIPIDRRAGR